MSRRMALHWQILIAMVLGIIVGIGARNLGFDMSSAFVFMLRLGADIFLKLLSMIVVPLVFSSVIVSVAGIGDAAHVGRMGGKTGAYYLITSFLAVVTGLLIVNLINPGVGSEIAKIAGGGLGGHSIQTPESLWTVLSRIVPRNPVEALANFDMISSIFFAIVFGIFANFLKPRRRVLIVDIADGIFEIMMHMARFIIKLAPIGVFCLVSKLMIATGFLAFKSLGLYVITVMIGLIFHFCITLPFILWVRTGVSPIRFAKAMSPALLTAFSTASSAATLSMTMECAKDRAGVSDKVSSFVLPMGATVNMDGTALYECVAVMFIAQVYGIDLSFTQQIIVVFTTVLASIGTAAVPHAGLVMMVIVLNAVGLPAEATGIILAVDRVLDMTRTMTNVWSDSVGAAVIAAAEGERIKISTVL